MSRGSEYLDEDDGPTDIPEQPAELDPTSPDANPVVTPVGQLAWETAHANSANTGFARVDTARAVSPQRVTRVGLVAPGANPVVAPDGTVYIGTVQGELRAFRADGTAYWTRQLNYSEHGGIHASPVVGADGSVYVISTHTVKIRDHQGDDDDFYTYVRSDSFLHKFTPGGGWVFQQAFPERYSGSEYTANRGATNAPPNLWRWNGTEAIMVPVVYKHLVGPELRLIAFATGGGVLADQLVTAASSPQTTDGDECFDFWGPAGWFFCPPYYLGVALDLGASFDAPEGPLEHVGIPMPGVAIRQDPQRGAPLVVMTDGKHDKIAFSFSPQTGFSQVARSSHTASIFTTPPVVQGYRTMVGTAASKLTFADSNFAQLPAVGLDMVGLDILTAAPTLLADGHIVVIGRGGTLNMIDGLLNPSLEWREPLSGVSIASAAASCTHFFVATTDELATYDAKSLTRVATLPWVDGGLSAPVIGPGGHVYAIVSSNLFVFLPPIRSIQDQVTGRTACDGLAGDSPGKYHP